MKEPLNNGRRPSITVDVAEPGAPERAGMVRCEIDRDLTFSTYSLRSYFFAGWKSEAYDALLVAAAVEYADRVLARSTMDWPRSISLRIPVHDLQRWRQATVSDALRDALEYLTGDSWDITFCRRRRGAAESPQTSLELPVDVQAVIPFSNGLDSRAVAGLLERTLGPRLVRVRLSARLQDKEGLKRRTPFTRVPYKVKGDFAESSARSRGFKFAIISGIAAYLAGADEIIVPESGQGALGPSLVTVGQSYEDYRSHPTFTRRMERLFNALFGTNVRFCFPQLWQTKGETLRRFIEECGDPSWAATRSCWQKRFVSFDNKQRQCGICAACMLRRMSVHAAGGIEPANQYVWERLDVPAFEQGMAEGFPAERAKKAMRHYAIAGTLHLDHLAAVPRRPGSGAKLDVASHQLALALGLERGAVRTRIGRLLDQHAHEWSGFVSSLGNESFIRDWAVEVQS